MKLAEKIYFFLLDLSVMEELSIEEIKEELTTPAGCLRLIKAIHQFRDDFPTEAARLIDEVIEAGLGA